jgi:hypothetical protein
MENPMAKKTAKKTTKKPTTQTKKTIGINMNKKMADELEARAISMHLSVSKYCTIILSEWLNSDRKLKLEEK